MHREVAAPAWGAVRRRPVDGLRMVPDAAPGTDRHRSRVRAVEALRHLMRRVGYSLMGEQAFSVGSGVVVQAAVLFVGIIQRGPAGDHVVGGLDLEVGVILVL